MCGRRGRGGGLGGLEGGKGVRGGESLGEGGEGAPSWSFRTCWWVGGLVCEFCGEVFVGGWEGGRVCCVLRHSCLCRGGRGISFSLEYGLILFVAL